MRNGAGRDVLKVWLYAAVVVFLAAWTSPFFYNAGKAMSEVTVGKPTNGFLKWLGDRCREGDFPAFFVAAAMGFALLLFFPFSEWLALKRAGRGVEIGQPLKKNRRGLLEFFTGLLLAAGIFLLMGYGLMSTGSFLFLGVPAGAGRWLLELLPWIVLGVVVQEWLLRGVALGIFLRAMQPLAAILLMALLSAVVFFMKSPGGLNVPDPDAEGVGFVLLKMIGLRLSDPQVLLAELLPLLAMAGVLGYARWRTASLWLPIGLHLGWQVADVLFGAVTRPIPRTDPLAVLLAGRGLTDGLIPLAGFLVVCGVVYFFTDGRDKSDEAT